MSAGGRALALVAFLSIAASVARALGAGQDLGFDFIAYHYYLGYSALADRLALDFLPAGFQGYQAPWPYASLHLLERAGATAAGNAALHASCHALNLVALFLLARLMLRGAPGGATVAAFWLLGACAPVYWRLVGTSSPDLATGAMVLMGLWLVVRSLPGSPGGAPWGIAAGAALLGAAAGMRWHNAIYVAALAVALVPARAFLPGVLGAAAGGLCAFAPWAWRLHGEFGSPTFPFFNGFFRSPDFPAAGLPLTNFVPQTLADFLALPFRIATYADWVYIESRLPDVRPGLLAVAALGGAVAWGARRARRRPASPASPPTPQSGFVARFFLVAAALWLATSANGRYGVALFLLLGPVCGLALQRLLPGRAVLLVIAAVVLWQAMLHQVFFRQMRPPSGPWTERHFDWELPAQAVREPALFLGFGYKSASSLAPRLPAGARHVNLVGQVTPGPEFPGAARIRRTIDAAGGRLYGAFDFYYTQQADPAARSIKRYFAEHLLAWGLEFGDRPCWQVRARPPAGGLGGWLNRVAGIAQRGAPPEFLLCELRVAGEQARAGALEARRAFLRRLEPLAAACPRVLGVPLSIVRVHGAWQVTSFATLEARLDFEDGGAIHLLQMRPPYAEVTLGTGTLRADPARAQDCDAWFAALDDAAAATPR